MLHLSPLKRPYEKEPAWYLIKIHGYFNQEWRECFQATIQVQYHDKSGLNENCSEAGGLEGLRPARELKTFTPTCGIPVECSDFYDYWAAHGIYYGNSFRLLRTISWDGVSSAKAIVEASIAEYHTVDIVHPTILDAALQALLTQASMGLSTTTNTCVPHQLTNSWISGSGWAQSKLSTLHVTSMATARPGKRGLQGTLQIVTDDGSLLANFKESRDQLPPDLQRYIRWMGYHVERDFTIENLGEEVDNPTEVILREIEHLVDKSKPGSVLAGETDPIRLIFDDQLAKSFYDDVFKSLSTSRFRYLLALLSHENPRLRIIEVGAGTGAWSELILSIFREIERTTGVWGFSHYVYTDVSPALFDQAREVLASDLSRIEFKILDLEKDVTQQGFDLHGYDLVLAGSVFHATTDLTRTLKNVQQLLKPDGTLLTAELTKPDDVVMNMVFGLLPGWWTFDDKWRHHVPIIDEQQWDELLKETGFSGAELVFKDYEDPDCHFSSVVMSRVQGTTPERLACEIALVLNTQSIPQIELAMELESAFASLASSRVSQISIEDSKALCLRKEDIVISLIEWDASPLNILSSSFFHAVKKLVRNTTNLLWVTSTSTNSSSYPFHHLMKGFFRSIRIEAIEKRIIQLEVETCRSGSPTYVASILKVFQDAFEAGYPDLEYRVEGGMITTGRMIEEVSRNDKMNGFAYPQMRNEAWVASRPLKLTLGTPGVLDTLHFIEDREYEDDLSPNKIEILTTKWGLNFRDIFVALGQIDDDELGCECAGVVTRVGDCCGSDIQPGDKVCFRSVGCFRTYIQTPVATVTKIPESVSPRTAVSILCPGITAYQSLVNVAHLCKGEKVLIHSGAGATGQMAIRVAQMLGAEVFTTVGYNDKKKLLMENFGLADDHIFYSRNASFSAGIKRVTQGYGVDVVLNSLSGDALRASWDCVAPYGRFIEIGKVDILANAALPMGNFQKNVSYSAVDINHIIQTKRCLATQLQKDILNLAATGVLQPPAPIHEFSIGDIESAFRYFQSGTNTGRTIILPRESDLVPDALFEKMSYEQWELTIRSKAHSSWNLHRLLPNLDFFIQLSSLAGIVGPVAQSNYAAGCTFQDALAHHRIATGQKAVSLDVGWMTDVGIIAETKAYQRYRQNVDDMQRVKADDLLAVLEIYCDPSLPILPLEKSQLLIGVMTPAHRLSRGLAPTPATEQPLYLGFSELYDDTACSTVDKEADFTTLFRNSKTLENRAEVVVGALVSRLARALSMSVDNVEPTKSFSDYGVDSLMAVELRNWIDKNFQANVAVFDIMGGTSIASIGEIVARRSSCGIAE
ncbi:hypothetical protein F4782DRAFT_550402 [Xylaria castorea]|nr:hypothetical protein F4782DRAFT_550402 [Xylaria castorea]